MGVKNLREGKKKATSSLFEAYAMYPYGGGYYMQPPQPYPMFAQGPSVPMPPGPPPMYAPYFVPQGYYQPPVAFPQPPPYVQPQQRQDSLRFVETIPPSAPPTMVAAAQREQPRRLVPTQSPPVVAAQEEVTTRNPLKDALSDALLEASREIDNANKQAVSHFVSFNDIDYSSRKSTPAPLSYGEGSVPIDNHILNWRDLVGLPANTQVMSVQNDGITPMLQTNV